MSVNSLILSSFFPLRPRQLPYELSQLAAAKLKRLDGSEEAVNGVDLWRRTGAVIMVVRRPG